MIKSQSAMEYLMTYGWAILIIAVVLAALFELGVFNPITFAPKASPGSCQVVRPEGAGTTNFISLEGECNGELPQYVAQFKPFAGANSTIVITNSTSPMPPLIPVTVTAWIKPKASQGLSYGAGVIFTWQTGTGISDVNTITLGVSNDGSGGWWWDNGGGGNWPGVPADKWSFIAMEVYYPSNTIQIYVNSQSYNYTGPTLTVQDSPTYLAIGYLDWQKDRGYNGSIANVQIYNTTLSANDVQALYQEGIGGAPIKIQNLVGWWPLNGNANDYSGNGNNGVPSGVTYTSNWYSGYSTP